MNKEVILGINGYSKRVHDASACITVDGNLITMAEEERFTRRKNAFGQVPHNAIASCLNTAGLNVDDIDTIAVGWDFNRIFSNMGRRGPSKDELVNLYLPKDIFRYSKRPDLEMVPHHLAHASSSYYLSGLNESMIVVMDGQGESQSTTIFSAKDAEIKQVESFPVTDSLGYFYEAVSEYVGLSRLDPGKTMGLASYGDPRLSFDLISETPNGYRVGLDQPMQTEMDLQQEITGTWLKILEEVFGDKNERVLVFDRVKSRFERLTRFSQYYKDIAASAQKTLEGIVFHLIDTFCSSASQNLCLAGGVGLNCTMNGAIARRPDVKELFVPPFTNDSGVSVGAALYVSDKKPSSPLETAALGPSYSNDEVSRVLDKFGIQYVLSDDIGRKIAELLAGNKIAAWFQGRMEAGPRALGNRSILGNPINPETHQRLNEIKNREQWRPLAPSFLADRLGEYMIDPSNSPFMLRAFLVKPGMSGRIPAAVHVDGTSRAQTVKQEVNPEFHRAITEFERLTGVPAIMNTSFNLDDEPIVNSPTDALRTFFSSSADYLAMGNALISK